MLPIDNMKKTVQLGLRIDKELIKKIEKLAEIDRVDKMSWIRQALATHVNIEEKIAIDEAIEDYIHLRCDENELVKIASFDKIPMDVQYARKEVIAKLKNEAKSK